MIDANFTLYNIFINIFRERERENLSLRANFYSFFFLCSRLNEIDIDMKSYCIHHSNCNSVTDKYSYIFC